MKKEEVLAELSIVDDKNLNGTIVLKNQLPVTIIVNRFSWENATLAIDVQDTNQNNIKLSPPPIPPNNLDIYDVILKQDEQLKIPIKNLEILTEEIRQKDIRIRCKGFYKKLGDEKFYKTLSPWIILPSKNDD